MSASLGVAVALDQAPDTATLIAAADKALFAAKEAGRNRMVAAE
jgi:PleD family two-component response regulator